MDATANWDGGREREGSDPIYLSGKAGLKGEGRRRST